MFPIIRNLSLAAALASTPAAAQTANQVWDVYDSHAQLIGTNLNQGLVARLNGTAPTVMQWGPGGFSTEVILWYTDDGCHTSPYIDDEMPPAMSYWYGVPNEILGPATSKPQTMTLLSQYFYDGVSASCYNGFSVTKPVVPATYLTLKTFYPPFCVVPNGTKPMC